MLPLLISLGVVGSATRRIMHWTGKAILWLVVALLVLAVVGAIYQAIATWRAERAHPPSGEMVDVGNHNRLHINCVGQGSPTVVLDAALGTMLASWVRVQREVSGTTRVCAYDRAGMGWSERGSEPRDVKAGHRRTTRLARGCQHRGRPLRACGPFVRRPVHADLRRPVS